MPDGEEGNPPLSTVFVDAAGFTGEVLTLGEMPGYEVMSALDGMGHVLVRDLIALFRLAVVETGRASLVDTMSYEQMTELADQWLMLSREAAMTNAEERGMGAGLELDT